MKRIYTLLSICMLMSIFTTELKGQSSNNEAYKSIFKSGLNSQIIKGEAFIGLNLSQVDGDKAYGYKRLGLHGGLGVIVPLYQKRDFSIDVALEVAFNQRGSRQRQQYLEDENGHTGEYNLYMNYFEVPLIFYFSDKQIASLGIGASYGRLVGLKEYEHGKLTDVNLNYTGEDKYNINDFCVIADAKVRLYERLKLGVRFQYSMSKIRTRDFYKVNGEFDCTRDQFNNVVTARLIYVFNEDKSQYVYDDYQFKGDNPRIHQKAIDKKLKKLRKKEAREEKRMDRKAKKAGKN